MRKKYYKVNGWKLIQYLGFLLILLGISFSFSSFKVSVLLHFGLIFVLIGAINILIYYIFIDISSHKKIFKKTK